MIAVKSFTASSTFDSDLLAWLTSLGVPVLLTMHALTTWSLVVVAQSIEATPQAQIQSIATAAVVTAQQNAADKLSVAQQSAAKLLSEVYKAEGGPPVIAPPNQVIVDSVGTIWGFGASNTITQNGVTVTGILGTRILLFKNFLYVLNTASHWILVTMSLGNKMTFTDVGTVQPGV